MSTHVERQSEAEQVVREIGRAARRQYSAEEKVRIVIAAQLGDENIAELCRKEGINPNLLLSLAEGVSGGEQEAASRRYRARRPARKSMGCGPSAAAQGVAGRGLARKPLAQKKHDRRWRVRYMRYAAAEKLEIIRLVERSPLSVRRTLAQLGISRATFYRWYQRYRARGAVALADGSQFRCGPGISFRKP